eukprot:1029274-Pyramimonas_sp.AAC.1
MQFRRRVLAGGIGHVVPKSSCLRFLDRTSRGRATGRRRAVIRSRSVTGARSAATCTTRAS